MKITCLQSTIRKIGESKRGQTLSSSHRAAIAAGQKRRHATRRFLVAMEALHQELIVTCDDSPTAAPPAPLEGEQQAPTFPTPAQPVPDAVRQELPQSPSAAPPSAPSSSFGASKRTSPAVDTSSLSDLCAEEQLDDVQREYRMRLTDFRRCASENFMVNRSSRLGLPVACISAIQVNSGTAGCFIAATNCPMRADCYSL